MEESGHLKMPSEDTESPWSWVRFSGIKLQRFHSEAGGECHEVSSSQPGLTFSLHFAYLTDSLNTGGGESTGT